MKKITLLFLLFTSFVFSQVIITPYPFEVNEPITITIDANSIATNCNGFSNPTKVYAHLGVGDDTNEYNISVVGNWGQDDGVGEMIDNGDGTWSITFTTNTYFNLTASQEKCVTKMGMVFRNEDGTQEFKANGCANFVYNVKSFQATLTSPALNSLSIINSGGNLNITATNTNGNANYVLKANGITIDTQNNISSYAFNHTNITINQNYELEITQGVSVICKKFSVLVDPGSLDAIMPANYQDGITYLSDTEAVLVLYATGKDFVYVAGSFNNWQPDSNYAMKRDFTRNNKRWLILTGLTPGQIETYQYWVVDKTPLANSPTLVKTADPYSTLVLSPFDDPGIPSSTYPNLPPYPAGQEREVSVLQTAQTPYNWQVTNFVKPKKEDLVVYEVLIRDFDVNRNYQDLIDKIDYLKNLNINAIELMPVMEFEFDDNWGYDTAFQRAMDKKYGPENKLKELIDLCHQNGIAVILDLVFNHAYGRNPMVRMWMNDPDGDGWGGPSSENPYFNQVARHTYAYGEDFNHSNVFTRNFVKSTIKYWIEEFKIDGFRWDLTKGFTQNCAGSEGCTNDYKPDRVAILKEYADYSWSLDPDHYVIFEHLGTDGFGDINGDGKTSLDEEIEWANYRYDEGKGIMLWCEMWDKYKQLGLGYADDISRMGHIAHGFDGKRTLGYPESHDKDRIMYEMMQYGNGGSGFDLNTALKRMSAIGAISIPIPGPKMVWNFGELGMDTSIWTCLDGSIDVGNDDCKLDPKLHPQWTENWLGDPNRNQVYSDYARLIDLKISEDVFEGEYSITTNTLTPKIYIWNDALPSSQLKNVVILANFTTTSQNVIPYFPYTGNWYDLMDETGSTFIVVDNTDDPINVPAGGFKIYGNKASTLSVDKFHESLFTIYPNPTKTSFKINKSVEELKIFDITGKLVKSFSGAFSKNDEFDISNLNQGLYLVKIENNGSFQTTKLLKL